MTLLRPGGGKPSERALIFVAMAQGACPVRVESVACAQHSIVRAAHNAPTARTAHLFLQVTGKNASERLDMRAATKADKHCK